MCYNKYTKYTCEHLRLHVTGIMFPRFLKYETFNKKRLAGDAETLATIFLKLILSNQLKEETFCIRLSLTTTGGY